MKTMATILMIFGACMDILLNIKVNILMLNKWSYSPPPWCWFSKPKMTIIFWACSPISLNKCLFGVHSRSPTNHIPLKYTINSAIPTTLMSLFLLYPTTLWNRCSQFKTQFLFSHFLPLCHGFEINPKHTLTHIMLSSFSCCHYCYVDFTLFHNVTCHTNYCLLCICINSSISRALWLPRTWYNGEFRVYKCPIKGSNRIRARLPHSIPLAFPMVA
jgi:hypothetical protein